MKKYRYKSLVLNKLALWRCCFSYVEPTMMFCERETISSGNTKSIFLLFQVGSEVQHLE